MIDLRFRWKNPNLFGFLITSAAIVAVSLSVLVFPHEGFIVRDRFALAFVLVVGAVGRIRGTRAGVVTAFLSFFVLLLLELVVVPTAGVADIVDIVIDLGIFLGVALSQGVQIGELRERERDALRREHETALLGRLSAQLVPDLPIETIAERVVGGLSELLGTRDAILFFAGPNGLQTSRRKIAAVIDADPVMLQLAEWSFDHSTAVGKTLPKQSCPGTFEWLETVPHGVAVPGAERDDFFVPLVSSTGVEGVLRLATSGPGHPDCHEVTTLTYAARLLATFCERQRLQELAARAEALEEGERLKSALVSSVSHQLKTPLAAATATITSLVEEGSDAHGIDPETQADLESAEADLGVLRQHIDHLLDLSRLEASQWQPVKEWNDLHDVSSSVRSALPEGLRSRVELHLPVDMPLLRFDFVQMSRALTHLVENALAYAPKDSRIVIGGAPVPGGGARLWVADEGPGVSGEQKSLVFGKFFRGDAAGATPHGTGLGLAIVADIVGCHGGTVWVEDNEPRGARFMIELPSEEEGRAVG